jgi:hypothetical protein
MHAVTITQNRSNYWTGFGVLMALGLLIVSAVGMIVSWPIEMTFEWILFSILFLGALVLGGNYVYWLFLPRNAVFSVSAEQIRIEDQPVFKWVTRTFSPSEVVEISYSSESGSRLKTRDGKVYILSDVIMMQRAAIFAAIAAQHPHIALKGNHQPNKPEMATPSKPSDLI